MYFYPFWMVFPIGIFPFDINDMEINVEEWIWTLVFFWIKLDYKNIMFFRLTTPRLFLFFEVGEVQLILQLKN